MQDEALIEAVRKQSLLYDKELLAYRNAERREASWQLIADELNNTVAECKKRWTVLRARYSRVKKELKDDAWNGTGSVKVSRQLLKLYQLLNFLDNFVEPSRTPSDASRIHDDNEEDSFGNDETTAGEHGYLSDNDGSVTHSVKTEPTDYETSYNHEPTTVSRSGNKRRHEIEFSAEKRAKKQLVVESKYEESDEVTCFMMSFVPTIKRLPPPKQALAKVKIAALLLELEFGIDAWADLRRIGEHSVMHTMHNKAATSGT